MAMLAVVCAELGDRPRAALLYERLAPFADRQAVAGLAGFSLGSMHRYLALLSSTRGDVESAVLHFEAALVSNTRAGATLFVAYTQNDFAALLRCEGPRHDPERASALTRSAATTARRCNAVQLQRELDEKSRLATSSAVLKTNDQLVRRASGG
jgi:hypothetical protein